MSQKNHIMVEGRLLRTDKRFSDLKESQKERIAQWMYNSFRSYVLKNDRLPDEYGSMDIIVEMCKRIENANIWIPDDAVDGYYMKHHRKMIKRLARELESEGVDVPKYLRLDACPIDE